MTFPKLRQLMVLFIFGTGLRLSYAGEQTGCVSRAIVANSIREALADADWRIDIRDEDVAVPNIPAKTERPAMTVAAMSIDAPNGRIDARLTCANRGCMPFFASARVQQVPALAKTKWRRTSLARGLKGRDVRGVLVRAGQKASYVVQSGPVRLTIPVVCLQPGSLGDVVRARDERGSHILEGRVESPSVIIGVEANR